MQKRGLILGGGGARGAYQIGVVKALYENGYEFDGFAGTSIGSVNAAVLAQCDFERSLELWEDISMDQVFYEDEIPLVEMAIINKFPDNVKNVFKTAGKTINEIFDNKGFHTEKMREFLRTHIDEEKVRNSGKDFGLVTVSLTERKPYEVLLEDIPEGMLVNYIMASSSMLGFSPENIDGKTFLDGGIYRNCPTDLLLDKGYDDIIVIKIVGPKPFGGTGKANVKIICPSKSLGSMLHFDPDKSKERIELGYSDGLDFVRSQSG